VLGIQQIAIGGRSKAALRGLWVDLLGADSVGSYRNDRDNVDEDVVSVGDSVAQVEIDLMQPIDPDRSPKVHEPALNHIGLWIDDLAAAVTWLTENGVHLTRGGKRGAAGYEVCFIQPRGAPDAPRSGEGVLIELVQAPRELIDAHDDLTRSRMTYIRDMPPRDE
jgi:lactoylglutathione lyase